MEGPFWNPPVNMPIPIDGGKDRALPMRLKTTAALGLVARRGAKTGRS